MIESSAARQHSVRALAFGGASAALVGSVIALFAIDGGSGAYSVVYRVTGAGNAETISFITDGVARPPVSAQQHADVELPWEKRFTLPYGDLGFVSVAAQGDGGSTITVRIEVDDRLVRQTIATGDDVAVATADLAR